LNFLFLYPSVSADFLIPDQEVCPSFPPCSPFVLSRFPSRLNCFLCCEPLFWVATLSPLKLTPPQPSFPGAQTAGLCVQKHLPLPPRLRFRHANLSVPSITWCLFSPPDQRGVRTETFFSECLSPYFFSSQGVGGLKIFSQRPFFSHFLEFSTQVGS